MAKSPALVARGLSHAYAGGVNALAGVDLEVAGGECLAIIGANGSGKSTLLKAFSGTLAPSVGTATVLGAAAGGTSRGKVSYLAQAAALDPEMTVAETLGLFATFHAAGQGDRRDWTGLVACSFGLESAMPKRVDACSGGLRQRLHLALGFFPAAEVFLLDEPTQGLDPEGRDAFWGMLKSRTEAGGAALLVMHDMAEAESKCARIIVMAEGRIAAAGAPSDLIRMHGACTWSAELGRPPVDSQAWTRKFLDEPGVVSASAGPTRINLRLAPDGPDDTRLCALSEGLGASVSAYTRRRPDLLSVFQAFSSAESSGSSADGRRAGTGNGRNRGKRG